MCLSHAGIVINVWNSLSSDTVDFRTLGSFKRTIKLADFSSFLKRFNLKSYLHVYCLYVCGLVCIVCVCVCVCMFVCMGSSK